MKIIIDIPEEVYRASQILDVKYEDTVQIPLEVIAKGTPLPKGHERKFEGIVVNYPSEELCTYPEYKGKPYFSIKILRYHFIKFFNFIVL